MEILAQKTTWMDNWDVVPLLARSRDVFTRVKKKRKLIKSSLLISWSWLPSPSTKLRKKKMEKYELK